jgi:hypothetical protein
MLFGASSCRHHELNKLLFFTKYSTSDCLLEQLTTNENSTRPLANCTELIGLFYPFSLPLAHSCSLPLDHLWFCLHHLQAPFDDGSALGSELPILPTERIKNSPFQTQLSHGYKTLAGRTLLCSNTGESRTGFLWVFGGGHHSWDKAGLTAGAVIHPMLPE